MSKSGIWVEDFKPQKLDDLILTDEYRTKFDKMVKTKTIPHLLFHGTPGLGKTSTAEVLCKEVGTEYMKVNVPLESGMDLLRTKLSQFASTMSLGGSCNKVIIMDECDNPSPQIAEPFFKALQPLIEKFQKNCSFILTTNYPEKLPEAIRSRTQDFEFFVENQKEYCKTIMGKVESMLESEKIEYSKKVVSKIIIKYLPDLRAIINALDKHKDFLNDEKVLYRLDGSNIAPLLSCIRTKDAGGMREFIVNNITITDTIYRKLYNSIKEFIDPSSMASAILILDDYMRHHNIVIDKEIHLMAMLI